MNNRLRFAIAISFSVILAFGIISWLTKNPKFVLFALVPAFLGVITTWQAERSKGVQR